METSRRPNDEPPRSLRERKKDRTRRTIQAEALRLFAEKGFQATTIEEIAAAAEVAPRTFFRYFPTKEEVVFWSPYQPMLAGFVAARPDHERDRLLERIKLTFRTPALHPRLRQQQADWAVGVAALLADRLDARPDDLEVRAIAAAVAAALFVAIEEWQARDGQGDLGALIDRALGSVLAGPLRATATPKRR